MSAATRTPREETSKTLELMQEMGAESFDPIPPEQYLCFLDKDIRITPSAQEALAWMRKWTIRGRTGGRSSYASDGPKRPLRLKDMAAELDWKAPFASRIWAELEDAGLVRKDDKERLYLCGRVKPRRKLNAADADADDYEGMTEYERFCCERLPHYVWKQFKRLDPESRRNASVEYYEADAYIRRVRADAVGQVRDWEEEYLARLFAKYGITLRRHEEATTQDEPETPRRFKVALDVRPAEELTVQNFSADPVQDISDTQYSTSAETVRDSYPYETEIDRDDRVSKCEPEAESSLSCEDLPTPQIEEETPTPAPAPEPEPAATETQAAKPFSVEGESTRPTAKATGPIAAYVETLFGKGQSPVILMKFETLAAEFQITPEAVTRFLLEKVEDKIQNNYPIKSAGALLQFAREDMPGWIAQNRRELSHGARQEAPALISDPTPPAEELRDLEIWLCERPNHPDIDYTRDRIAKLRAQLGDAAPPPYRPPTPAEEIARLEAELKEYLLRKPTGAFDVWARATHAKIKKLKQEQAKAAGA
jgi:hypothetical protein